MGSPLTTTQPPSLDAFTQECHSFLATHYPPKQVADEFCWGEGSDRVAVFEEPDREVEVLRVAEVREWRRQLFSSGLAWICGPTEYGGRDLPIGYQRTFDGLARTFDTPGNGPLSISLGMIAPTILAHGEPSAKKKYLAPMHRGDLIACQLFSEPGAGSDLASIETKAVRDGDGWRISGQKVWTSGAHYSDIGEILCQTTTSPRHRNLTAFVVDMHAPGVDVRPLRQMTGGASFNEVFLEDVWVPDIDRLGDVGEGWRVAMTTLSNERSAIGSESYGGSGLLKIERFKAMAAHFGRDSDPVCRQMLASLYTNIKVAKFTRLRADNARRAGHPPGPEASLGKLALVRNMADISAVVSYVLGPRLCADGGEWGTYAWVNFILGAPGYRIGGGTDEVMKTIVAERVLGLPKEPTPAI